MRILVKQFEQLSAAELYQIYRLRGKVFVVEQNCPYLDPDDYDLQAWHVMMYDDAELAGYARILPPGLHGGEPAIGRVVVEKKYRGIQAGQLLMKYCINKSLELYNNQDIVISAQAYLDKFYTNLGFSAEGAGYLEDNIPHIKMRYRVHK